MTAAGSTDREPLLTIRRRPAFWTRRFWTLFAPTACEGHARRRAFRSYVTPEGKGKAPIIVVYEHHYLEDQVQYQIRTGTPDSDRAVPVLPALEKLVGVVGGCRS